MKLAVISSFPPKKCGIAEFNQDLMAELLPLLNPVELYSVAVNEGDDWVNGYPKDVVFQIRKNKREDYFQAAELINRTNPDIVLFQHQFALFGGFCGKFALDLINNINRPLICVVHTIPVRADAHKPINKREFFVRSAPKVDQFVVFTLDGKRKLTDYGITNEKISVIDHGAPDILAYEPSNIRRELGIAPDEFFIFSFGLLQKGKGLDYVIKAMPAVARRNLNCRLVIVATPLRGPENEEYFQELQALIATLNVGKYVLFKRGFLSKERLYAYINACDAGVLPYVYKSYISSGALSFFTAAAKPVITTRFAYASYLLSEDAAAFVPFKNSRAIGQAICRLATDKSYSASIQAKLMILRQSILWENIAKQYLRVIRKIIA